MSNMNWYETEDWYAPLPKQEPVQPVRQAVVQEPPKKKKHLAAWIAGILAVALLVGLCVPAALKLSSAALAKTDGADSGSSGNQPQIPGWYSGEGGDADEEMPDDPADFFESYYQPTDSAAAVVNIERGALQPDFALTLLPQTGEELNLQDLYEKCAPSIVGISGYIDGKSGYNWGTGVILTSDGLILTNTHVIDECDRAVVTLYDDREFEAKLIGADTVSDIAILRIDATGLTPAEFGDSSSLRVGDRVAAIGNPLGDTFRGTLTDGIISAISRDISYKGRSMTLLQTNTALNEGNSGGALFNMYGQVVGITNMKMMSSYSSIEGIGFAIPSANAREVINSLVRYGEVRGRPSIGITVGGIPPEAKALYHMPDGLYISAVLESSDAYAKGIREGDVLLEVNHIPVTTTKEVNDIKNEYGVGDTLTFTIWRNGETLEFDVVLMDNNDLYG